MGFLNVYMKGENAESVARSVKSIADSFDRIATAVERGVDKFDPALVVRVVEAIERMNQAPLFWSQWPQPIYWTDGGRWVPDGDDSDL